jgi:hypothetical protein
MIFVFGSNLGGKHGAGAARFALNHHGAIWGQAVGRQGNSYAIPTKDEHIIHTLTLEAIQRHVFDFIIYAKLHYPSAVTHAAGDALQFQVTRIGCGLASLRDRDVAPMFKDAPDNCYFDEVWKPWLGDQTLAGTQRPYWGTF